MKLAQLQRQMAADIMNPLGRGDGLRRHIRADYIKPNDCLTSRQRLEIYSRSYWYRLIDSLYEDFPGTRAVLGRRAFVRMLEAYLTDCPSRSFSMRDLGSRLEAWLRRNQGYAGKKLAIVLDMVRLEWAHIEAWDAESTAPLEVEDLAAMQKHFALSLQPHVQLLELHYRVDELRLRVNTSAASARIRIPRSFAPKPRFVIVHRRNLSVYYRSVLPEEFRVLRAMRLGRDAVRAIERALAGCALEPAQRGSVIESWFRTWAELGWLGVGPRGPTRVALRSQGD